jgi:hypothetical protein
MAPTSPTLIRERAVALSTPTEKPFSGRAVKNDVFQLMDLIVSLMCSPTNVFSNSTGRRNPDDCYLLLTADMAEFALYTLLFWGSSWIRYPL